MSGEMQRLSGVLTKEARQKLTEVMSDIGRDKRKCLVVEDSIIGFIGFVTDWPFLRELGVASLKSLSDAEIGEDVENVVYIMRPKSSNFLKVCQHVRFLRARPEPSNHYLLLTPRKVQLCNEIMEAENVLSEVHVMELALDAVPYENDVISLELHSAFYNTQILGESDQMYASARAIMKVQSIMGIIPEIIGFGHNSRITAEMCLRMRKEATKFDPLISPKIGRLVLIDRGIDLITPLCTQLTHEGLIDEVLGIENGYVAFHKPQTGPRAMQPAGQGSKKTKVQLSSQDMLFKDIRDLSFAKVGPMLHKKAKAMSAKYDERHDVKTVKEMKNFVGQLSGLQQQHQSLSIHTAIAEEILRIASEKDFNNILNCEQNILCNGDTSQIKDFIDTAIAREMKLPIVLRLLCLWSITSGGLRSDQYTHYCREIVHTYGVKHIVTLDNLASANLFREYSGKPAYPHLRKMLRLINDDIDEMDPDDISYVHSGYAPLSVRLVEAISRKGDLRNVDQIENMLPGGFFRTTQNLPPNVQMRLQLNDSEKSQPSMHFVFFLGGCTFTEIAALRFLAQNETPAAEYLIGTTGIINGSSFIQQFTKAM
eukprot:Clim_evm25s141 gene=Clim_evmTU25s141